MPPVLRLSQFLPYRLSVTSNAVSDRLATLYQVEFGLRIPEWRLIAVLGERGGMTQVELGDRTVMDKMTVSRAAAILVRRGLAARERDDRDGRQRRLALTASGEDLYRRVAPMALRMEADLLDGFSDAERRTLADLLVRLQRAAEAASDPANR